jgi:peptidoglycan/LPS O-acetylase OafA/YrhL
MAREDDEHKRLQLHGYIPGLDVLRGVAVGAVVVFHGFFKIGYPDDSLKPEAILVRLTDVGKQGVYLFFVLSGFLITSILLKQREKPDYYKNFYVRRALRILPAYLLLLVVLKALGVVHWKFVLACLLFVNNMGKLLHTRTGEYGALWTLAVEEQFYIVWPTFVQRLRRGSSLIVVLLLGCVLAPLLRVVMTLRGISDYTFAPTNMDMLLCGALCALLMERGVLHRGNIVRIYRRLFAVGLLLLAPYLYIECFYRFTSLRVFSLWDAFGRYDLICIFVAGVLLAVERAQRPEAARRGPGARFLVFLGYISYGLYLVHPLLFDVYDRLTSGHALGQARTRFSMLLVRFVVVALVSVLTAAVSRRYYEQLFLQRKKQLAPYTGQSAATESIS